MRAILSVIGSILWEVFQFCIYATISFLLLLFMTDMADFLPPVPQMEMLKGFIVWGCVYVGVVLFIHLVFAVLARSFRHRLLVVPIAVSKRYALLLGRVASTLGVWMTMYLSLRTGEPWYVSIFVMFFSL